MNYMNRFFIVLFLLSFSLLKGQEPKDFLVSNSYFITNVKVITHADSDPKDYSILVRDGIIQEVGKNVALPSDAIVIDGGDSLYVYPAFINMATHIGQKKLDEDKRKHSLNSIQKSASTFLDKEDSKLDKLRKAGFGTLCMVPNGYMLPGQMSLHNLDPNYSNIYYTPAFVFGQYTTPRNGYPYTLIGILAEYKQLLTQAKYAKEYFDEYDQNPSGLPVPQYSETVKGLIPVISKEKKLALRAPSHLHISRSMQLQKEMDFDLIIMEAKEITEHIEILKEKQIGLALSLELPKEIKEDSTLQNDYQKTFEQKRQEVYKMMMSEPALCEKNDIEFAFSYLSVDPSDIHSNIKKLHEHGLSEKAALSALIDVPAKLLKVDNRLGSIEKGKIANILVLKHQYLADDFNPEYLLSGGHLFDYTKDKPTEEKLKEDKDFEYFGLYSISINLDNNVPKGTFNLSYSKEQVSGIINVNSISDKVNLTNIELSKKSLTGNFETTYQGTSISGKMIMSFQGKNVTGTIDLGNNQIFPIEGTLQAKPE